MRRSFSVVANSGHLHMHLWGELHGGIRALGLSLCQSEDFILTKASDDIGAVNLSSVSLRVGIRVSIALAFTSRVGVAVNLSSISVRVRIRVGIASGVGIASRVGVAVRVSIASAISIAAAVSITAALAFAAALGFTAALGLASNLGKLLVA